MKAGKECVRLEKCESHGGYCSNPQLGFVDDSERLWRLIFSPDMYNVDSGVVRLSALSKKYFSQGMSVSREQFVDLEQVPNYVKRVATIIRRRRPEVKGQACVSIKAEDFRKASLFICPSSSKNWAPHADIWLTESITPSQFSKIRNDLYEKIKSVDLEVEIPF